MWKKLKLSQQKILEPLAESWDAMESERKKKWLGVAKRYPKMSFQEQQRIQSPMQNWNALTTNVNWCVKDTRKWSNCQLRNIKKSSGDGMNMSNYQKGLEKVLKS